MEDVTIPGWAVAAFIVLFLPWAAWITRQVWANEKDSAVREATLTTVKDNIKGIYDELQQGDAKIEKRFTELNHKFDLFINQEMTFLKQLVKKES